MIFESRSVKSAAVHQPSSFGRYISLRGPIPDGCGYPQIVMRHVFALILTTFSASSVFSQDLWNESGWYITPNIQMIPPVDRALLSSPATLQSKPLGDLDGDGTVDSVYIRPEFCSDLGQDGYSFVFSGSTIPRIRTGVTCINLDCLFPVGDIDENGTIELGQFVTTCAGRSKQIFVLTLSSGRWKILGKAQFDANFPEPSVQSRIAKVGKGRFSVREIGNDGAFVFRDSTIAFTIH